MIHTVFFIQLLASIWMCSLIWLIQLLHYPSFHYIVEKDLPAFSRFHQKRISLLVVPAMFIELFSMLYLLYLSHWDPIFLFCTICLAGIWISTFFLQVPCHQKLLISGTKQIISRLVLSNWIRTLLWTIKTIALIVLLFKSLVF